MRREHFIWLIPIAVGAAAYWRADAMHGIAEEVKISGRSSDEGRGSERRLRTSVELDAELERAAIEAREQEQRTLDEIGLMDLEKLKARALGLEAKIKAAELVGDFEKFHQLRDRQSHLIEVLGARGGEAEAVWVMANFPDETWSFIEEWAKVKPEDALRYIGRSTQPGICSIETVMDILDQLGKKDPRALKSAVGTVPWDLFVFENRDPFAWRDYGLVARIPDIDAAEVWWKSGAARDLAEEGVHLHNLFAIWAAKDTQEAIVAWAGWPGQGTERWVDELMTIVIQSSVMEEGSEPMKKGLMKLDAGSLAKVSAAAGKLQVAYPSDVSGVGEIMAAFKNLLETLPPPP